MVVGCNTQFSLRSVLRGQVASCYWESFERRHAALETQATHLTGTKMSTCKVLIMLWPQLLDGCKDQKMSGTNFVSSQCLG